MKQPLSRRERSVLSVFDHKTDCVAVSEVITPFTVTTVEVLENVQRLCSANPFRPIIDLVLE